MNREFEQSVQIPKERGRIMKKLVEKVKRFFKQEKEVPDFKKSAPIKRITEESEQKAKEVK